LYFFSEFITLIFSVIHLRAHSCYSFLEALPTPEQLAQAGRDTGMPALALTDHLSLAGAVEFYLDCQQAGVQPVLGLEIDLGLPYHLSGMSGPASQGQLALLATDLSGWRSLCSLVSVLLSDPDPRGNPGGVCSLSLLDQHSTSLLCLTGGRQSLPAQMVELGQSERAANLLGSLEDIFPSRLYVELQRHSEVDQRISVSLAELAHAAHLPIVATHSIYYLTPSQADLQRTLAAIRLVTPLNSLPDRAAAPPSASFLDQQKMSALFGDLPEALRASEEIATRCRLELPLGKAKFPQVPLPPGKTAIQVLRQKAETGARRLYGEITPDIQARLDHELSTIGERGYEAIFLIMEEIIQYAHAIDVPVSSRGSAASSLVAHCLGITSPDPLRLNLYFERFLNPARSTPPDIDTDLDSRRRDLVIQHVFDTYGRERVAMVGTVNRFRPRSALGDVAKAHGLPLDEVHRLTAALPYFFRPGLDEDDPILQNPYAELMAQYSDQRHQLIFQQAIGLIGLPRHLSVHAGGVVITPGALTDLVPVQPSGAKGVTITQFDLEPLERIGLVKIDLLGIRGLTVLGDVAEAVRSWRQTEYRTSLDVLESIPLDDTLTSQLVSRCATIGCFQIESPGMRATLHDINAHTVDDVMAALALYRPGPLKGGLRDVYVRRHKGEEPVVHLHPALAPLLEDTFGVILYQEQVLRIANGLAGMSLVESDLLRRAMSHFDPGKQMETLKQHFIAGALEKSGVPEEVSARVWEMMAAFSGYGFPKAHAASYSLVAWRSAWCKAHFPAEFMAAVLANWGGYYSQRVYMSEARRMGLPVRPPHINHSKREFSASYPDGNPVLYMGLDQVRDLTRRSQETILRQRPFTSLADFLARANPRQHEAANLIRCGALEGLGTIPDLLRQIESGGWKPGQLSLFDVVDTNLEDWPLSDKVSAQEELLGISVDAHPLELVADRIAEAGAISTLEAAGQVGSRVRVAGMRLSGRRSRTGQGEMMAFLTIEDLEGMLDVVVFPEAYRRSRAALSGPGPYLIEGTMVVEPARAEPLLHAERVDRL
jgi:DNA-directed DNA polymerase III PolC